jgi:eukaryotic-like serine/threonine-protein kinase
MMQPSKVSEPIPGYFIRERIGVGGYGEVWRAQAPGGLAKAIKFVYGHFDDERASRELKALNRIKEVRHPFLLSLERFEIIDGQLLIVTELADMSLKDRAQQVKAAGLNNIPRDELLGYLSDAADALDYMSEQFSLQHLDVKPENLLLVGGRVKVADFGLVKELHDVAASLMGGLTPIYASPEVFDGAPTQFSDQYSLAIVYQEMLTSMLPFAGRTAAQLASQHLHASPRLAPLPAKDQPIIARALAKDPGRRFSSCRALIGALIAAERLVPNQTAANETRQAGPAESTSDTTPILSRAVGTDCDWKPAGAPNGASGSARSCNGHTQVIAAHVAAHRGKPAPAKAVVDLPPIEPSSVETNRRPTLFLGVGGTAGHALVQLRRLLFDRLAQNTSLPAIQMLLLDTDAKSLERAATGLQHAGPADIRTLALPLRHAHDYTTDSRQLLQWLSRRWLYNIPRSLHTEGRRPLGRLALVDHSQQVFAQLREALVALTTSEATADSAKPSSMSTDWQAPRIWIVSSIAGGTGGGMVLDLAYAVRMILREMGLSDEGVCGILAHSTDRSPANGDLAIANTYACLNELHHYSACEGFPGDVACGLPASHQCTFSHAYFVHLGHNLSDDDYRQATNSLASFLYLNTVSDASGTFEQCRALTPPSIAGTSLRSFGLACVGGVHTSLPEIAAERLCRFVLARWGAERDLAGETRAQPETPNAPANKSEVEQSAADHVSENHFDFESMAGQVMRIVEKEFGGDSKTVYLALRASVTKVHDKIVAGPGGYVVRCLQGIRNLFGLELSHDELTRTGPSSSRTAFEQGLKEISASIGDAICQWIYGLIERPDVGVNDSRRTQEWYSKHLRSLETKGTDRLRQTIQEIQSLEQELHNSDHAGSPRGLFGVRRAVRPSAKTEAALLRVMHLRFEETAFRGLCKLIRLILARVAAAGDQIRDLQRELGRLSDALGDAPEGDAFPRETATGAATDEVRVAVEAAISTQLPELARAVDERFRADVLEQKGGLRSTLQNTEATRIPLLLALRAHARAELVRALKQVSVPKVMLSESAEAHSQTTRLQECVKRARPLLTECGGSQRLLAVLPETAGASDLKHSLTSTLDPSPTIVNDSAPDVVLCYEVQELDIAQVAGKVVADRNELVKIAERLHTRTDVRWSELADAVSQVEFELPAC